MKAILKNTRTGWTTLAVVLAATFTVYPVYAGGGPSSGGTGTSNVVVTNTPAQSVPVKDQNNGAYQPFHFTSAITTNIAFAHVNVPVPAGKRLVIEQVSAEVSIWNTPGSYPSIGVTGYEAGVDASAWIPMTYVGEGDTGYNYFVVQPVHLYADGGSNAVLSLFKSRDTSHLYSGTVSGYISLVGHLVDIP